MNALIVIGIVGGGVFIMAVFALIAKKQQEKQV
jgi:hypothetical protein